MWGDIAGALIGGYFTKEASDAIMDADDLKDIFRYQNPDTSNPFSSTTTDWESGQRSTQFSPEIQKLFDSLLGEIGAGPQYYEQDPYRREMMDRMMGAQGSRYGMDPYPDPNRDRGYTGRYGASGNAAGPGSEEDETPPYDPGMGDPAPGTGSHGGRYPGDQVQSPQDTPWDAPVNNPRGPMGPQAGGVGSLSPGLVGTSPVGNNSWMPGWLQGPQQGSMNQLQWNDFLQQYGKAAGSGLGALLGIPGGGQLGEMGADMYQNHLFNNYRFDSPVDPAQNTIDNPMADFMAEVNGPELPMSPIDPQANRDPAGVASGQSLAQSEAQARAMGGSGIGGPRMSGYNSVMYQRGVPSMLPADLDRNGADDYVSPLAPPWMEKR